MEVIIPHESIDFQDKKVPKPATKSEATETSTLKIGHMHELEVDLNVVIKEDELEDYDADHSPFPEVRGVVPEVDDQAIPANTFRMWILGILFTMVGCGVNQFFSMRYPSVTLVSLVAELLAFPLGVALAKTLPLYTMDLGLLGKWCLNPDRHFNIKEHCVIVIMSNVSFGNGSPDATSIIQAGKGFYGFDLQPGFEILIVLCCQLLGFGIAGLASPLLVEPASIIWPSVLSNCALLSTLHSRGNAIANGWKISRFRFFMYVMIGSGVWYFFPGLIFVGLSYFTWVCWIVPKNIIVNQVFGMVSGLGLSPITFDWSQISYNSNPLLAPTWAAMNVFAGFVMFFWIVVPALYYSNIWYTAYLPIYSSNLYDNTGSKYNVSKVLTNETFDVAKYESYSPGFLPANYAFRYGTSFATFTCVPVHILLWHYKQIKDGIMGRAKLDIHARLMRLYPRAPWYWFGGIILAIVALTITMVTVYDTKLPWWAILITTVVPALYIIPCGIIQGMTNQDVNTLNVMAEFAAGYMFNGRPLANMIFKTLSVDVVTQGLYFVADMKLGIATILGSLTQAGVTIWMLGNVKDICSSAQPNGFTCPGGRTVFSSSIVWGAIGPARSYSIGKIYSGLLHFFWIGALMPLISWAIWKYWKKSDGTHRDYMRWLNWPIIFIGTINIPPATGINYSSWAAVNLIFNWWIKKRWFAWWTKFNYILAAALDTGLALSAIAIFFCITYPGGVFPSWWGNTVYLNTADGQSLPWLSLPESGMFGPANGTWH
ncbi:small oligopeptide transporter-like protein [Coleophoma crateriformis]|uniref:Small oligopeptide transporter-like protein n=1 Tax=Coleophoma crateriformis TaxID=565419 RepID=A0A3D8SLN5_9HELO|nr:small oligopeptide transporter-like protein [Coleophoma crateriformis]